MCAASLRGLCVPRPGVPRIHARRVKPQLEARLGTQGDLDRTSLSREGPSARALLPVLQSGVEDAVHAPIAGIDTSFRKLILAGYVFGLSRQCLIIRDMETPWGFIYEALSGQFP